MNNVNYSNKKRNRPIEEDKKKNENKDIKTNYLSINNNGNIIQNNLSNENNCKDPDIITEEDFLKIQEFEYNFPPISLIEDRNNNKILNSKSPHAIKNILCLDKSRILISYDKDSPNVFLYKYDLIQSDFQPLYCINFHPTPIIFICEKINGQLFSLSDTCV